MTRDSVGCYCILHICMIISIRVLVSQIYCQQLRAIPCFEHKLPCLSCLTHLTLGIRYASKPLSRLLSALVFCRFGWIRVDSGGFGWIRVDSGGFAFHVLILTVFIS